MKELNGYLLEVFEDVQCELGEPEVADLISMALDRKVEIAISRLKQEINLAEEQQ